MADLAERLDLCFLASFPTLTPNDVRRAGIESVAAWDSTAHVVLLASIAEEFGVEFEIEDYETLTSYDRILESLRARIAGA